MRFDYKSYLKNVSQFLWAKITREELLAGEKKYVCEK